MECLPIHVRAGHPAFCHLDQASVPLPVLNRIKGRFFFGGDPSDMEIVDSMIPAGITVQFFADLIDAVRHQSQPPFHGFPPHLEGVGDID